MNKSVTIIGLGYIGLPTAVVLASSGYNVHGIDVNEDAVSKINSGKAHIKEPGLDDKLKLVISEKKLKAYKQIKKSDIYIICVPTPFNLDDGEPKADISFVMQAANSISEVIKDNDLVIIESTCPVGTTKNIESYIYNQRPDLQNISLAYCPERVLPGKVLDELINNDRVVGGVNNNSSDSAASFYESFINGSVYKTNSQTAELCKLTENSFRDVNIAFANELSLICENNSVNVWDLIKLANKHPRVDILQPGPGVGGHCIAIDPWFIVAGNRDQSRLIKKARQVNEAKPNWCVELIKRELKNIENPKILCLGASFKPNIDDLRESPALEIIKKLITNKMSVDCVEPNIKKHKYLNLVEMDSDLSVYDLIVILVAHNEFNNEKFIEKISGSKVIDFCGLLQSKV